ncbi:hypothetical protein ACH4PU_35365 [Streptomyces sp. NPDC021100]|uniref:hypothetical protein n=1 Tax=Streptomyces sp. NPDC021100 TaxID=3365114 RepID=UPI003797D61B
MVALAGTAVRLRSAGGAESVVLASYLMAAPDFAVPAPRTRSRSDGASLALGHEPKLTDPFGR